MPFVKIEPIRTNITDQEGQFAIEIIGDGELMAREYVHLRAMQNDELPINYCKVDKRAQILKFNVPIRLAQWPRTIDIIIRDIDRHAVYSDFNATFNTVRN